MTRKLNIDNDLQGQKTEHQLPTAVWQNGGFSTKFYGSSSIELLCKTEHLPFDFRHFAKLQNVAQPHNSIKTDPILAILGGFVFSTTRECAKLGCLKNGTVYFWSSIFGKNVKIKTFLRFDETPNDSKFYLSVDN